MLLFIHVYFNMIVTWQTVIHLYLLIYLFIYSSQSVKCVMWLTDILAISTFLSQKVVTMLQNATIIVKKNNSAVTCLNNCCPIAFTHAIEKCLKQQVITHIKSSIPPTLDPLSSSLMGKIIVLWIGYHIIYHRLGPLPSITSKHLCKNIVHWFYFRIQH